MITEDKIIKIVDESTHTRGVSVEQVSSQGALIVKDTGISSLIAGTASVPASILPLPTLYNGSKTVPTGTAEAIASTQAISSVTVKSLSTNTVSVFVGATGVTTSTGFELLAGESISLDIDNLADVFVISGSISQNIRYIAV